MRNFFQAFAKDESGATAIEYGLIAALLSVAIIGTIGTVRENLTTTYSEIGSQLEDANNLAP